MDSAKLLVRKFEGKLREYFQVIKKHASQIEVRTNNLRKLILNKNERRLGEDFLAYPVVKA